MRALIKVTDGEPASIHPGQEPDDRGQFPALADEGLVGQVSIAVSIAPVKLGQHVPSVEAAELVPGRALESRSHRGNVQRELVLL